MFLHSGKMLVPGVFACEDHFGSRVRGPMYADFDRLVLDWWPVACDKSLCSAAKYGEIR